jgi:hypothetical protein
MITAAHNYSDAALGGRRNQADRPGSRDNRPEGTDGLDDPFHRLCC